MPSALITGANSGLGLEFARQFLGLGWQLHACCRKPENAQDLRELGNSAPDRLHVHAVDLADFASIDSLASNLAGAPIDLLINNAGIMDTEPADFSEENRGKIQALGGLNYFGWSEVFRINVIGTARLTEAVASVLRFQGA